MPTSRNRDYSSPPDTFHSMAATYAWNPYAVITGAQNPQTGAWSAAELSQDGSLRVSLTSGINIDSLNISGLVVNTDQLETINTSGVQFLAAISGFTRFLQTGSLATSSSNPVGVTGTRVDTASGYATGTFLMVGGRAVEVSGFNPGYTSGAGAMLNIDRLNGAVLVEPTDLNAQFDSVTVLYQQNSTVSNSSISGSFAATALQTGLALSLNTGRRAWFVANTSNSNPLYVRLSSAAASTGTFNFILNPSSSAGQQGGSWLDSPAQYTGPVSVSGTSFVIWEL